MTLIKAVATVGGLTLLSRIAGFIRDILTAGFLGAGPLADAFFVALKLPNLFRRITAEGSVSYAFIPLYISIKEKEGKEKASFFLSQSFSLMLAILLPFVVLMIAAMPYVIYGIAPGFIEDPLRYHLAVDLSRITFLYLVLISLVALLGSVLNAHDKFIPFAIMPVIFNIVLIITLVFFYDIGQTVGHSLAWAVLLSGFLQFLWVFYSLKKAGLSLRLVRNIWGKNVKKLLTLMAPSALGAGVVQVNLFVDMILASFLPAGSISFLYYADRLNQLPLGVVGIAIGTALLPMLSRAIQQNDLQKQESLLSRSIEFSLLLSIPAMIAFLLMPIEIMTVLFERGSFDKADSLASAKALMAYSIGLPAYILIKILNTAYFAHEDTLSPVKISIGITLCNILLSLILIQFFAHVGIALATGIVGWLHCGFLWYSLRHRGFVKIDPASFKTIGMIIMASIMMGGTLYFLLQFMNPVIFAEGVLRKIMGLLIVIASSVIVYILAVWQMGLINKEKIRRYFFSRR